MREEYTVENQHSDYWAVADSKLNEVMGSDSRDWAEGFAAGLNSDIDRPQLRPVVLAFAQIMEEKLRKHDPERGVAGWQELNGPALLFKSLRSALGELSDAWLQGRPAVEIASEAADVAVYAMMIADVCGGLQRDVEP